MLVRINGHTWNTESKHLEDARAIRLALIGATEKPWIILWRDGMFVAVPAIADTTEDTLVLTPFDKDDVVDDHWAEIDGYPLVDWQSEVANGDTRVSYHLWARNKRDG